MQRAVILDRDGTIIEERNYLRDPKQVVLLAGAVAGLNRLRDLGLTLIVLTNQSGIGRGYFSRADADAVNARMIELLRGHGVLIDDLYICPHTPEDGCECRKPRTANLLDASEKWRFDLNAAFVIGDKACDVEVGARVGAITFLVRTGYGAESAANGVQATYVVDDLSQAAAMIEQLVRTDGPSEVTGGQRAAAIPR